MPRLLGLLTLLATLHCAIACAAVQPGTGFGVLAYRLQLAPDLQAKAIRGTEWVRLRATSDELTDIVFTHNPMVVDDVTARGSVVQVTAEAGGMHFHLFRPLRLGEVLTLQVRYHGTPVQGITFQPHSMVTSYFACEWMFCAEDAPGDKATFDLELHVPAGLTSFAVGRRVRVRRLADGSELHRWRVDVPYSAYLYEFAVGPFTMVTVPLDHGQVLTYLGEGASREQLKQLFAETPAMVAFLSEKAGAPLPLRTYGQLLVPGDEAQEAATYSILGRDALTPDNNWAMVHELAHQWWGNSVTCSTWRDFWLNEGFAVYLTAVWKLHAHGQAAYDQEMGEARKRMDRLKAANFDRPLAWQGEYPKLWMRRSVQYSKGALFLEALHTDMGDAAFWAGVRSYLHAHRGGTVVSADFEQSMQQASGHDLKPLFQEWVYGDTVSLG